MLFRAALCVVVLSSLIALPSLQASDGGIALGACVESARYAAHVKVTSIESPADGETRARAFCVVRKILLGYIYMDGQDRVRLEFEPNAPGAPAVGDEFLLLADACSSKAGAVMVFDATAAGVHRVPTSSRERLNELLQKRLDFAWRCVDELGEMLPGARDEAEKAFEDVQSGKRTSLSNLSPGADLLFDYVAMVSMQPGVAPAERPTLTQSQRAELTLKALRVAVGLTEESATVAARLVSGHGNGAHGLLSPAKLDFAQAEPALRKLRESGEMLQLLKYLMLHDADGRALSWALSLAQAEDELAFFVQWMLIEQIEETYLCRDALFNTLAPSASDSLPYESAQERALACLVDRKLWRLVSYLGEGAGIPAEMPKGGEAAMHKSRHSAYAASPARVEYVEVYCYLLISRSGNDARLLEMRKGISEHSRQSGDLEKVSEVKKLIQQQKGQFPPALRRWELRRR